MRKLTLHVVIFAARGQAKMYSKISFADAEPADVCVPAEDDADAEQQALSSASAAVSAVVLADEASMLSATGMTGNTLKRVAVILAPALVFRTRLTPLGAVGSALAVLGTLSYSIAKNQGAVRIANR